MKKVIWIWTIEACPYLIALSSEFPIRTAFKVIFCENFWFDHENASKKRSFKLSYELHELSQLENEFKSDYEKLSEQCEIFAKEVLDRVKK